jgi:hypothetical protein
MANPPPYPFLKRKTVKQRNHCGSETGWKVHQRYKEKSCRPCNEAHAIHLDQQKMIRRQALGMAPYTPLTRKNVNKALGRNQDPHVNRIAAIKKKAKDRADAMATAKAKGVRLPHVVRKSCSTEAGYQAHSANYEEFCAESTAAHNVYAIQRRAQKAGKKIEKVGERVLTRKERDA